MNKHHIGALVFGVALLAGCGSPGQSGSTPPLTDAPSGAASVAQSVHVARSADVASAAHSTKKGLPSPGIPGGPPYYGGLPVIRSPKLYITYWDWTTDPAGEKPRLESLYSGVGGSSWLNILTQYYDTTGHIANPTKLLKGTWSDNAVPLPPTPTNLGTEALYQAEATRASSHFGYDKNAIIVIATPHGYSYPPGTCQAYHDWNGNFNVTPTPTGGVPFIVLTYISDGGAPCGANQVNSGKAGLLDGLTILAGHELAEAMTDPFPVNGWSNDDDFEIADLCEGTVAPYVQNVKLSTGTFAMQMLWSNADGGCVIK